MDLKAGDVVKLKSGSPLMTIQKISKYDSEREDKANCVWFDGFTKCEGYFELVALKKHEG